LFKIPENHIPAPAGCIEKFLGEEICNSNIVRQSKISQDQRDLLERDISIEELDISAAQGNRRPIISLLSCLYKVASRALNNRLKKVRDTIFSRAQKGFTNERHIQEVLINVIEGIAHCKKHNIPACILSFDQAKAFDSVSHSYKQRVFEFFGFGPKFINLLNTLCINRSACIVFEDGSLSSNFDLERGDAQGNTPSPILYNMAQQIFLFKLELCPEIKSVFVNHLIRCCYKTVNPATPAL
jgi:hypothetical protein